MIIEFPENGTFKIEVTETEIHIVDEEGRERIVTRTDVDDEVVQEKSVQYLADTPVEAFDHAVGLRMSGWDKTMLNAQRGALSVEGVVA